MISRVATVVFLLTGWLMPGTAVGAPPPAPSPVPRDSCEWTFGQTSYTGSRRVRTVKVGPSRVRILLPPAYPRTERRYPVLYLLHGAQGSADSWLVYSDLVSFTASLPDRRQAVVVMPDTSLNSGIALDSADGTHLWETSPARDLPRWVGNHLRVRTDRRHTAIAGYSGGGDSAVPGPGAPGHVRGGRGVLASGVVLVRGGGGPGGAVGCVPRAGGL